MSHQAIGRRLTTSLVGIGVALALTAGAFVGSAVPAAAKTVGDVSATKAVATALTAKKVKKHYAKAYKKLPKAPRIVLDDTNRGAVTTVPTAVQGATIQVAAGLAANTKVKVWLFSAPRLAYYGTVAADGTIQVKIPLNAKVGDHKLAVFAGKTLVGWTDLAVTAVPITNLAVPTIAGKALTQYTVKAKAGTWSPKAVKLTYQWALDGVAIPKATKKTYKIKLTDKDKALTVTVTASRKGTTPVSVTSDPVTVTQLTFTNVTLPTVETKAFGTKSFRAKWFGHKSWIRKAFGGQVLKVTKGEWSVKGLTFSYQWVIDDAVVKTTKKSTFKPKATDAGKVLTVIITATRKGYSPVTVTTAPVTIQSKTTPVPAPDPVAPITTTSKQK